MRKLKLPLIIIVSGLGVALILVALNLGILHSRGPWQVTIATGTPGGTYFPMGQQLARVLEKHPKISEAASTPTAATLENVYLLVDSQSVNLAFMFTPGLVQVPTQKLERLRIVARLYTDVVQIVVRKDANIGSLEDLAGKKVYVGCELSGTKVFSCTLLDSLHIYPAERVDAGNYSDAARMLIDGTIEAAFFASGKPTVAVKTALESGACNLLDLGSNIEKVKASIPNLADEKIPANFYVNQPTEIRTVGADALLMCREDLSEHLVILILDELFNNIENLFMAHTRAEDIRIERAFTDLPAVVKIHRGAVKFWQREREETLLIATGSPGGRYYELGKVIQSLLRQRGIHARAIHSDGSVANAGLLQARPVRTLAIMQYDVALAAYWGAIEPVYQVKGDEINVEIPEVKDMRRLATLHPEKVHIMMRRDRLTAQQADRKRIQVLRDIRFCAGPRESGSSVLTQATLAHHKIDPRHMTHLSVRDMVDRIHNGEIAAGFFVGHVPVSSPIRSLVDNEKIALLSIDPKFTSKLVGGPALSATTIAPETYPCQLDGEPAVETVGTKALLVTTSRLKEGGRIARALAEGAAFLQIDAADLAMELPSINLHPLARKYYQDAGYLPSKPPIDWYRRIWYILACTVILVGGIKSIVEVRRHGCRNRIGRSILSIDVSPVEVTSKLHWFKEIRADILQRVQMRWWEWRELNKDRWRYLDELIDSRISLMRENLTKEILKGIYALREDKELDKVARLERYAEKEVSIKDHFGRGELDKPGYSFLMGVLDQQRQLEHG